MNMEKRKKEVQGPTLKDGLEAEAEFIKEQRSKNGVDGWNLESIILIPDLSDGKPHDPYKDRLIAFFIKLVP